MALFGLTRPVSPEPLLRGDGVYLRPAAPSDYSSWSRLQGGEPRLSRALGADLAGRRPDPSGLSPPPAPPGRGHRSRRGLRVPHFRPDFGRAAWAGSRSAASGAACRRAGTLGYWMGAPHAGKGRMTRAVAATVEFAFSKLRLHRIEAACIPDNAPSIALLERNGFRREGYARGYLKIDGAWRDHLLFALVESDLVRDRRRPILTEQSICAPSSSRLRSSRGPVGQARPDAGRAGRGLASSCGSSCSPPSCLAAARRRAVQSVRVSARFRRHRPDPGGRALQRPGRPHPGLDRARRRRHRPAHRGQRARSRRAAVVDRVRSDQRFRRAIDPPDRRAAFPLRRLRRRLAGSRLVAHHHHHRKPGLGARARGQPGGGRLPPDARSRERP